MSALQPVYCRNCRFFRRTDDIGLPYRCRLGGSISKNDDNDCDNFSRRWWKFWVRPVGMW